MLQLLRAGAIYMIYTDATVGGVSKFLNNSAENAGGEFQDLHTEDDQKYVNVPGSGGQAYSVNRTNIA